MYIYLGLAETVYIQSNIRFAYRDFIQYTAYIYGFGQLYIYQKCCLHFVFLYTIRARPNAMYAHKTL